MFKKILKKSIVTTLTFAICGSILPISSHAERISSINLTNNPINLNNTVNTLPAPVIKQGRAVNTNYPQMPQPTVEAFSNHDGTGYLNVSWKPVDNVSKYQVILFNGSIHSYWDVPANQTSWTTKGKGMFPTSEQIEAGQVNFLRNGTGTEFSVDPSFLYKKAYELNGGLNYSDSTEYYVRVVAVYEDGASPISYATSTKIPLDFESNDTFNYFYNELHISSTEELDTEHLNTVYELVTNTNNEVESRAVVEDGYVGGTIIDGPYFVTYTNRDVRFVVSVLSGFISIHFPVSKAFAWAVLGATFLGTDIFIGPTYVGVWSYKAYDKSAKRSRTYLTTVHYKNSNYTKPLKVQTRPIN